jgi:hypothetical protein
MRREITRSSLSVTLRLVSDTQSESKSASSPFGPVKAGLITTQRTQDQQLSELLNILERKIESLQSKYLEDFATLRADTKEVLVPLYDFTTDTDGIK